MARRDPDRANPERDPEILRRRIRELEARLAAERSATSDRFRAAVESAPNGIVMVDGESRIQFANQRARELFGYTAEEMAVLKIEELMPERFRARHDGLRRDYHAAPEPRPMGIGRDLFALRKDGTEFPVEIGLTPIEIGGDRLILGMIADITERQSALAALREKARILASVHEAVLTIDADGRITSWNPGAEEIFGWREDEILGQPAARLGLPEEADRFATRVFPELQARGSFESTFRCRHRQGTPISLAIRAAWSSPGPDLPRGGAIVCAHDITRQKELEDEIVQISEKEQRRIGQDLHDDLCQQLAGIGCLAKAVQQEVEAGGGQPKAADALGRVVEMIAQANTRAREISRGLAPAVIQREGLPGALAELAARTQRLFGVPCSFHCPDPVFVENEKCAVQLYRIAQEAVSNAVKHSDASRIDLHLDLLPGQIRLRVVDDGRGLPPRATGTSSGLGLLTMAHRAKIVDGDLQIDSAPGRGATITCLAPHRNE